MVFIVFYKDILKEFVFRENDNSKLRLYIDRNQFNITKSFYVDFEKNNGKWSIHSNTNAYEIHHGGKSLSNFEFHDTNVITIKTINNEKISIISIKKHTDIIEFRKYIFKKEITVGNDCNCDIKYGFGKLVSGHHCTIREYRANYYVDDCSRNGVFVNTKKINGSYCLKFGDCIDVFGLKILFFNNIIAVGSQIEDYITSSRMEKYEVNNSFSKRNLIQKSSYNYFSPSPRCMYPLFRDKIKIDAPESPQFSRNKTLLEVIGPSLTMAIPMVIGCVLMGIGSSYSGGGSGLFMISGMVIAVLSAIFGAVWAFYNFNQTKKNEADDEFRRFDAYSNYLVKTADYIREKYTQNQNNLNLLYPSSDDCCNYKEDSYQLWSRNTLHEDFLFCRLGIGDLDFQSKIEIPEEKFSPVYDQLKDKPKILRENFKTLKSVPLGFDVMEHKLVGIVSGRHKRGANTIVNNIIVQLAANIDYTKLKIVFCFDEDKLSDKEQWNYVKILPHIWSEDKQIRYFASNKGEVSDVLYEFANIIRNRSELESMDNNIVIPYYVLFLSDISLLDGELISKYVFDNKQNYGFTTFIITDSFQKLPNKCDYIIQNDRDFNGIYSIYDVSQKHQRIKYDAVYLSRLYSFAKELSNIKVKEIGSSNKIPDSLEFFEMYNIKTADELDVLSRWKENKTWMSIRAVIGQKTGSDRCYLDLHEKYHGPHGLIAGTTGSGKSELIQTIILSLAINYSPDDIVFFVIDFKGGGMANLFAELPHLSGQISNLSGNQIQRGMISIKSENKRRQRLFNEYGVNNINSYSRLFKNGEALVPVPHLVIIVDEFAELKREEPDFMQELISVAQVGRSLGVHLILATQKPNGTVDDNIWSNSKFRLCLRVQDRQDSNDMIHRPDAAYLTQAGRCYMQVGNDEIFEQFQSGWSGAVCKNNTFEDDDIATMITNTGRTVIDGNKAKFRSRDLEQLEWTSKILKKIVDNAIIINEAVKKGENDFTSSAEKIISDLISDGEPIGKSTSEIALMSNFIRLVYSGCKTPEEVIKVASEKNIKLPECKEVTQLQAVVKYISKVAYENKYKNTAKLWLPLLKSRIELSSLENFEINFNGETWVKDNYNELSVVVGKYDDPQNQSQKSFEINLSTSGHIAICGSVVTGKSTFLQTLIFSSVMKFSPDYINFYLLDFSGGMLNAFENMPHVGDVFLDNNLDKIRKFFNMLNSIVEERKTLFSGGNYFQYIKDRNVKLPLIVVVIDNYIGFNEKTEGIYEEELINLSRIGVSFGINLVITASGFGVSEVTTRISDNIRTVVALEMSDNYKYMDVLRTSAISVYPEKNTKGRGLCFIDGRLLEFQTALSFNEDDYVRNDKIREIANVMQKVWSGDTARNVPYIPDEPNIDDFCKSQVYEDCIDKKWLVPVAYRDYDATAYCINLKDTYCYLISGKRRTGKTNILQVIMKSLVYANRGKVVVVEQSGSALRSVSKECNAQYIEDIDEIVDFFSQITQTFKERNRLKNNCIAQGMSYSQIFDKMSCFESIFILIDNLNEFFREIYSPSKGSQNYGEFIENIIEKGYLHNIYFFGCMNSDDYYDLYEYRAYKLFTEYKRGVHLGGYLSEQKIFDFDNLSYLESSKSMKRGIGMASTEELNIAEKIIVPFAGGANIK